MLITGTWEWWHNASYFHTGPVQKCPYTRPLREKTENASGIKCALTPLSKNCNTVAQWWAPISQTENRHQRKKNLSQMATHFCGLHECKKWETTREHSKTAQFFPSSLALPVKQRGFAQGKAHAKAIEIYELSGREYMNEVTSRTWKSDSGCLPVVVVTVKKYGFYLLHLPKAVG